MIPFGTMMQAAGSMPVMGKGVTGTGNPATVDNGSAKAGSDSSDSFSSWFRKLTGEDTAVAVDRGIADQLQNEITESKTMESEALEWDQLMSMIADGMEPSSELSDELETLDWDQLMSMIADAMEQSPELSDDKQVLKGVKRNEIQDVLQQLVNAGLLSGQASPNDVPSDPVPSNQVLTNLVMDSVNGSDPVVDFGNKTMAAVEKMPVGGQEGQSLGQGATVAGAVVKNVVASGLNAAAEQGAETAEWGQTRDRDGENTADFKQALQAQQNKERPVSKVDATLAQTGETAEEKNPEVNAQRVDEGTKKAVQGEDSLLSRKDFRQPRQSLSAASGQVDRDASPADKDSPDSTRAARNEIPGENRSADAVEKELPKGTASSESVKTSGTESNRFSDTIQEATRTMTEKTGTVQAAPSERAEASTAQRFQATVMDQIVDKANLRSIRGRSEIQIRLKPDFLGNVQMNIAADKEQLVVRMVTDQPVVKEIVEANLHQLKTELQHQGLTIDRFEVTVNPDAGQQQNREQFAQTFKNPSFQNGQRQRSEQEPETNPRGNGSREDNHPSDAEADGVNYFA